MDSKKIHYIGGLPRSGSTLLSNILAQNPEFHVTATSGLHAVFAGIKQSFANASILAANQKEKYVATQKGAAEGFFSDVEQNIIFDKNRGWNIFADDLEYVYGSDVKIILCVRDVTEILASFEMIYRQSNVRSQMLNVPPIMQARIHSWFPKNGNYNEVMSSLVGADYMTLTELNNRGFGDKVLFVDYRFLTKEPEIQLRRIYKYLDLEYYEHDFESVEQIVEDNDTVWGMTNLHKIKPKVEPARSKAHEIIGMLIEDYPENMSFWRK